MVAFINNALLRVYTAVQGRLADERGQDLIEYAMLGGLIAVAAVGLGLGLYTGALQAMATGIGNCIDFNTGTVCEPF